ncbi:MAG: hypothetical protein AAGC96_13065, partial [Pseudomonadota bacterium]
MRNLVLWFLALGFALSVHLGVLSLIISNSEQGTDDIDTDGAFDRAISLTLVEDAGQGTAGSDANRVAGNQTETPVDDPSEAEPTLTAVPETPATEDPEPLTTDEGSSGEDVPEEGDWQTQTRPSQDKSQPVETQKPTNRESSRTDEKRDRPANEAALNQDPVPSDRVSNTDKETAEADRQSEQPERKPSEPEPQDAVEQAVPAKKSKAASQAPKTPPAAKPSK